MWSSPRPTMSFNMPKNSTFTRTIVIVTDGPGALWFQRIGGACSLGFRLEGGIVRTCGVYSHMAKGQAAILVPAGSDAGGSGARSFRDVTRTQWNAFFAAFLGWSLDGFDFSILSFLLIDIQHSFAVDKSLAGALGSVTLLFRLVGGMGAGTAADRFG